MSQHQDIVDGNRQSRERLRAIVARLSPADLGRPLSAGWTVADALAHLAFWDFRALNLLERWAQGPFTLNDEEDIEVDATNEAAHRLASGLAPELRARLAVEAADAVDGRIEAGGPALADAILSGGQPVNLMRFEHRLEHVEELEALFA